MVSTERVFALSAFEGVRLIRLYAANQPDCPLDELLSIIEHVEADASNLDLEAAVYLHRLIENGSPLDGDCFYQACITAIVTKHQPTWFNVMRQGRARFLDSLEQNNKDVFAAAGLMKEPPPIEVALWWDSLAGFARMLTDLEKMKQARIAEAHSIEHERERLKSLGIDKEPEWKGLDDNFAGYDVLSYDPGEFAPTNRMIEVKSTTASPLRFIVTRNEWEQAQRLGPAYFFHVWDMQKSPPVLYERTFAQIAVHIPCDNENGKWKTAEIPIGT
jgi:hypothetical protein